MSNSKLVNKKMLTRQNYDVGRDGYTIKKITIHHCAGVMSIEEIGNFFANGSRQVSAHYGIGNDGRIVQCVDEKNTAWTDGNRKSNCTSVTIETSNSKTGGKWPVSDEALESLIKLVADIAKRNNLGKLVKRKNLTWHRMYASTTCPGDYLLSKMDYIIKKANEINTPKFKTLLELRVRTGAGTIYRNKKVKELTENGKEYVVNNDPNEKAIYKKGTIITALKVYKNLSGNIWVKTPSGWICYKDKKGTYLKEV